MMSRDGVWWSELIGKRETGSAGWRNGFQRNGSCKLTSLEFLWLPLFCVLNYSILPSQVSSGTTTTLSCATWDTLHYKDKEANILLKISIESGQSLYTSGPGLVVQGNQANKFACSFNERLKRILSQVKSKRDLLSCKQVFSVDVSQVLALLLGLLGGREERRPRATAGGIAIMGRGEMRWDEAKGEGGASYLIIWMYVWLLCIASYLVNVHTVSTVL